MKLTVVEQVVKSRVEDERGWKIDFDHRDATRGRQFNSLTEARQIAQQLCTTSNTIYIIDDNRTIETWALKNGKLVLLQ